MNRFVFRPTLPVLGATLVALAAGATPARAAISLAGQTFVITESAATGGCCGAPVVNYSNRVLPGATVGTVVGGLNGNYGISGAVWIDPSVQRLWFTISDSAGFGSFSNWIIHLDFPDLVGVGELTALSYDPDVGLPLRFVSSAAAFNPTSIDLTFNGQPATRGSFSYAWRYQTQALAAAPVGSVPEPTTWVMMMAGMAAVGWSLRKVGHATQARTVAATF